MAKHRAPRSIWLKVSEAVVGYGLIAIVAGALATPIATAFRVGLL